MKSKKKSKHIFLIFNDFGLGGVQKKMVDIANYANEKGKYRNYTIHLVFRKQAEFSFVPFLDSDISNVHFVPDFHYFHRIRALFYLCLLSLKYKPRTIFVFLQHSLIYAVIMKIVILFNTTKLVVGQDNILSFDNRKPFVKKEIPKSIIKFLYKFVDRYITQTEFSKSDLVSNFGVKDNLVEVIPNWLYKNKKNTTRLRIKKTNDILYVGRFSDQKKLLRLLKVVMLVKQKIPNIRVSLVGNGDKLLDIAEFIFKNKLERNVIIKATTYSVDYEISNSKIFVLTSEYEGHRLVLLEAMSKGVVPVVLRYPGVNEYLENGKNGYIENSLEKLASRVIFLLSSSSTLLSVGRASKRTVMKKFNERLIDETLSILI